MIFQEQLRYIYDLTTDNYVIDCGGYKGEFSSKIHQIYGSDVDCFEPIPSFYNECVYNLRGYPIVRVFNKGIGGSNRKEVLHLETDRTGMFAQGKDVEIEIIDIKDVVKDKNVDLIKINIEGMEYELLERVIELGLQKQLKNIQVQFHRIAPDSENRYEKIREKLLETHELTFDYPFVWQNFRLKDKSVV